MSKRNYRRRNDSESDNEGISNDDSTSQTVQDILELQKLKKRPAGLSAIELALGKEVPREVQLTTDPFKLRTGGMIDLKTIKRSDVNNADVEDGIKQTFSKESHLRDEDEEMRRYVEEQLAKRKGAMQESSGDSSKRFQPADSLYELPDHLKRYQSKRTEDMLSNQMLCGIPEVDLGIEAKIKNIEETEAAKLKLLKETMDKKKNLEETVTARQNLVKDLAKGYVQHSYYKIDEVTDVGTDDAKRRRVAEPLERIRTEPVPVVADDTPRWMLDGKVVDRPSRSAASSKTRYEMNPDPSDKACFDNFKRKFVNDHR